jgi:hypothetical protein
MNKENVRIPNGVSFNDEEWVYAVCRKMDRTWDHDVKLR